MDLTTLRREAKLYDTIHIFFDNQEILVEVKFYNVIKENMAKLYDFVETAFSKNATLSFLQYAFQSGASLFSGVTFIATSDKKCLTFIIYGKESTKKK